MKHLFKLSIMVMVISVLLGSIFLLTACNKDPEVIQLNDETINKIVDDVIANIPSMSDFSVHSVNKSEELNTKPSTKVSVIIDCAIKGALTESKSYSKIEYNINGEIESSESFLQKQIDGNFYSFISEYEKSGKDVYNSKKYYLLTQSQFLSEINGFNSIDSIESFTLYSLDSIKSKASRNTATRVGDEVTIVSEYSESSFYNGVESVDKYKFTITIVNNFIQKTNMEHECYDDSVLIQTQTATSAFIYNISDVPNPKLSEYEYAGEKNK